MDAGMKRCRQRGVRVVSSGIPIFTPASMSLLRKLAGETAIYGISYILSRILHYVLFTWYLTRVFGEARDLYGIYKDLYFYVAVLLVVLTFRMETAYFRYAREDKPAVTMMSVTFLTGFSGLFFLLLWLFRADIAGWLRYDEMTTHLMLLGGVLFFDTLSAVPFASLRQQNRPWRFLSLKLGAIVLNIVLVLFFLELLPTLADKHSFWHSIYTSHNQLYFVFLSNLLASVITFVFLLPMMQIRMWRWDTTVLRKMLHYSWPLVLVAIAGVINQSSAITFQKWILPEDMTSNLSAGGIYAAAASLAILLNLFTIAFNYAAEPFFFAHQQREDARRIFADVGLLFTIVGAVMMLCILGYMDLVQLLLGKNFRDGITVVPILLLAYLLLGIYYNVSVWYKLADKTRWGAWIAIAGTAITIIGNIWLIPRIGVMGSAWSALACYLVMCILAYLQGQKHYPIPYNISRMFLWIAMALLAYRLMTFIRDIFQDQLFLILAANTLIIIGYGWLVFTMERQLMIQIKRRA